MSFMKHLPIVLILFAVLIVPVKAVSVEAPKVPSSGEAYMPETVSSFGESLKSMAETVISQLRSDFGSAIQTGLSLLAAAMLLSTVSVWNGKGNLPIKLVGALAGGTLLLGSSQNMIWLASETIQDLTDYGKLLFPVLTTAMAAQGGVTASTSLYAGTMVLDILLSHFLSGLLLPAVRIFLALAMAAAVTGEKLLKRMGDFIKNSVSWSLKVLLTAFTSYMSITGVVSGTTDAAALKATKVTISSVVPVVGSILSDASEAVLVSTGVLRNAAGVYGLLAIFAVVLAPFGKIGLQYLVLKASASLCALFDAGGLQEMVEDVSTAMGLLLAMTGTVSLLLLISTVCFLKEVG